MDRTRIDILAGYLNENGLLPQDDLNDLWESLGRRDTHVSCFASAYKNAQFGWDAMLALADAGLPFPAWLEGEDVALHRAYSYLRGSTPDEATEQALALMTPRLRMEKQIVDGILLSAECSFEKISELMGLSEDAVLLYEKAFFNVVDRRKDIAYLRAQVYPDGRMAEMVDDYLHTEESRFILRRAGYNNGLKDVLYFAGFPTNMGDLMTSANAAKQLEAVLMTNGVVMARNGMVHQNNSHALYHSKGLLAAAKMGGADNSGDENDDLPGVGDSLKGQMRDAQQARLNQEKLAKEKRVVEIAATPAAAPAGPAVAGSKVDPVSQAAANAGVAVYVPKKKA